MAKLTAWLFTIWGILLVLPLIGVVSLDSIAAWLIPLIVLVIGLGKLSRNYAKKKRR